MGVTSPLKQYFSLALGAQAANPLELARAYAAFANKGFRIDIRGRKPGTTWNRPRVVDAVENVEGAVVDDFRQQQRRVLSERTASTVNRLLQGVVREGTATRAAIPGFAVAGKTGTTENYGDAWFVGYTPDLVVAIWVGYPRELRFMLTEFDGEPVDRRLDPGRDLEDVRRAGAPVPRQGAAGVRRGAASVRVAAHGRPARRPRPARQRQLPQRVHGALLLGRRARGGRRTASRTRSRSRTSSGESSAVAEQRLAAQPLEWRVLYRPATPGEPTGVVVEQIPKKGRASAYDEVQLWLPKAMHGVIPKVQGLKLGAGAADASGSSSSTSASHPGPTGRRSRWSRRSRRQASPPEPGMPVRLVVGRG